LESIATAINFTKASEDAATDFAFVEASLAPRKPTLIYDHLLAQCAGQPAKISALLTFFKENNKKQVDMRPGLIEFAKTHELLRPFPSVITSSPTSVSGFHTTPEHRSDLVAVVSGVS
jgi:hypothetical protein